MVDDGRCPLPSPSCSMTAFRSSPKGGKALAAELAQLVPRAGLTSAQTNGVIPAGHAPSLPLAVCLKAEFHRSAAAGEKIVNGNFL